MKYWLVWFVLNTPIIYAGEHPARAFFFRHFILTILPTYLQGTINALDKDTWSGFNDNQEQALVLYHKKLLRLRRLVLFLSINRQLRSKYEYLVEPIYNRMVENNDKCWPLLDAIEMFTFISKNPTNLLQGTYSDYLALYCRYSNIMFFFGYMISDAKSKIDCNTVFKPLALFCISGDTIYINKKDIHEKIKTIFFQLAQGIILRYPNGFCVDNYTVHPILFPDDSGSTVTSNVAKPAQAELKKIQTEKFKLIVYNFDNGYLNYIIIPRK